VQRQARKNIKPLEVAEFLRERGWRGVRAITRVGHGEWSMAFNFSSADKTYVGRFSAFEEDYRKDQFAARRALRSRFRRCSSSAQRSVAPSGPAGLGRMEPLVFDTEAAGGLTARELEVAALLLGA
jgi:hypothetical protein